MLPNWRTRSGVSPGFVLLTGIMSIALTFVTFYREHPAADSLLLRPVSEATDETTVAISPSTETSSSLVPLPTAEDPSIFDQFTLETPNDSLTQQQIDDDNDDTPSRQQPTANSTSSVPQVAWIMSYGGSGTSYTILNVEQLTNATTASNYGADYDPCLPLLPELSPQGPFVRSPQKPLPHARYILTKTHCGGYCIDCAPETYLHTASSFETACLMGQKRRPTGVVVTVTYARTIPQAAIHLIRDPFDNLVGRMHLAVRHHERRGGGGGNAAAEWATKFTTTTAGIQDWCRYLDDKYAVLERQAAHDDNEGLSWAHTYQHVPCHAEWYRYVQWHNLAYETAVHRLQLPVQYLYFSNYTSNYQQTVQEILDFLEVQSVPDPMEPYPFVPGKTYRDLFTVQHAQAAARMVHDLASPPVWKLLQHFF